MFEPYLRGMVTVGGTRQDRSPEWAFVRWAALFGAAIQGFWVVASVYIVVEVGLSPLELLLLGTALELTVLVAEVPTGVMADTVSRKWSMVVSMLVTGSGFVVIGLGDSFWLLAVGNVVWGIGWTFTSGADVAWITDELLHRGVDRVAVDRALTRRARWQQRGGAAGLVSFGILGWSTTMSTAMVVDGAVVLSLAAWIGWLFPEDGFSAARRHRRAEAVRILRVGLSLVRTEPTVVRILLVTLLFNFGAEAMDRLTEARLIGLGLPAGISPVLFFTLLGVVGLVAGAGLLRLVERHIGRPDRARVIFGALSWLAALGALVVAAAPMAMVGAVGVFLARGLAWSTLPVVASVWINRSTGTDARATVQSFLGQASSAGQIVGGLALGVIATAAGLPAAIATAAVLFALSGALILRSSP